MTDRQEGFTLAELMIATSVFSVVLLLCTTALIQVGRQFYKGITSINVQTVARTVINDIQLVAQSSGRAITNAGPVVITSASNLQVSSICVGDVRYTFTLDRQTDAASSHVIDNTIPGNRRVRHALWKDQLVGVCKPADLSQNNPSTDTDETILSGALSKGTNGKGLTSKGMRVQEFSVVENNGLVVIDMGLLIGDDALIKRDTVTKAIISCESSRAGGQFCSQSRLKTTVLRRISR
jgi:prepilin-type N-terminal cleavage/methylation domain-containing protein